MIPSTPHSIRARIRASASLLLAWEHWTRLLLGLRHNEGLDLATEDDVRDAVDRLAALIAATPLDYAALGPVISEQLWRLPALRDWLAGAFSALPDQKPGNRDPASAVATLLWSLFPRSPVVALLGLFSALFYFLGGVGVRQGSWPAALVVSIAYGISLMTSLAAGSLPGLPSLIFGAILLTNLRAAFLASEWKPVGPDEDTPQRFNETLVDKLVDQLPARLWPVLHIPFYVLGGIVILFTTLSLAAVVAHRFGLLPSVPSTPP